MVFASGTTELGDSGYVQTAGTTMLTGGDVMTQNVTYSTVDIQGGTLGGAGTIDGFVTCEGTIAPGTFSKAGTLTITQTYVQSSTGTLAVSLGGTQAGSEFDVLAVGGDVTLDGSLTVALLGGYEPAVGDTYEVLTSGGADPDTGMFATVNMPAGVVLTTTYDPNDVKLGITEVSMPDAGAPDAGTTAGSGGTSTAGTGGTSTAGSGGTSAAGTGGATSGATSGGGSGAGGGGGNSSSSSGSCAAVGAPASGGGAWLLIACAGLAAAARGRGACRPRRDARTLSLARGRGEGRAERRRRERGAARVRAPALDAALADRLAPTCDPVEESAREPSGIALGNARPGGHRERERATRVGHPALDLGTDVEGAGACGSTHHAQVQRALPQEVPALNRVAREYVIDEAARRRRAETRAAEAARVGLVRVGRIVGAARRDGRERGGADRRSAARGGGARGPRSPGASSALASRAAGGPARRGALEGRRPRAAARNDLEDGRAERDHGEEQSSHRRGAEQAAGHGTEPSKGPQGP